MKQFKIWRSFLLGLATFGFGGCSADAPTAPRLPEAGSAGLITDLVGTLVSKDALTRKTALTQDITVSAVIGKSGGILRIPAAGFELTVPEGAVTSPTAFTVTAIQGNLVAYEFGPHGLKFRVPLKARQDLSGTNWRPINLKPLVAGYFLERADLDEGDAKALVSEVIEGLTIPLDKQFNWQIQHFSGYVVAW
jgi:hypothetical protein